MHIQSVLLKRAVWKGPNIVPLPIKEALQAKRPVRTKARAATIIPQFVGIDFEIHNGKDFIKVRISEDMVGHKFGEFAPTRKPFKYTQTKNK